MQLVEQHVIDRSDPRFAVIDDAAFKSKNLYNAALYEMRQAFIHQGIYLSYSEMDKRLQQHEAYKALPAKVSQHVLKQLADAWKAFREAKASYEEDPSRFTGRPKLPKYKHKTEGRNILVLYLASHTWRSEQARDTRGDSTLYASYRGENKTKEYRSSAYRPSERSLCHRSDLQQRTRPGASRSLFLRCH
jgi:hypothetical protein